MTTTLNDVYTSTGAKFFAHPEAMENLRDGRGQPIVAHVMLTDVCNHKCAFCSVQARAGDSLEFGEVLGFVDILRRRGLKAVILSGGGNPILYKCRTSRRDINDVVDALHERGLEVGLITNGVALKDYDPQWRHDLGTFEPRYSWATVKPETLDKLTWVRVSMAGLDHAERAVYVPDVDPARTALGFSYVAHDIYREPNDPHHGQVSRPEDLLSGDRERTPDQPFEARMAELTDQIGAYVRRHQPRYVRLLPNCLEPAKIPARCEQLGKMARLINAEVGGEVVFVQYKPPAAPKACLLGYVHPVLNCDGHVYPCDSCVLNEAAGHQFGHSWRVCHWSEVGRIYDEPVRSLVGDPAAQCPGCVFTQSNATLLGVYASVLPIVAPDPLPEHHNFV